MDKITHNRVTGPKIIGTILFAVITIALWAVMAVFLAGMLVQPAQSTSAANVRTDITEEFEFMLTKKIGYSVMSRTILFQNMPSFLPLTTMRC